MMLLRHLKQLRETESALSNTNVVFSLLHHGEKDTLTPVDIKSRKSKFASFPGYPLTAVGKVTVKIRCLISTSAALPTAPITFPDPHLS